MTPSELSAIFDDYRARFARNAADELGYFRSLRPYERAISDAALARVEGRKHPHQHRISLTALQQSRLRLLANVVALRRSGSFDALHDEVERLIRPIHGIGELTVYDTSLRIGARLELAPSKVYLHAGTRKGARALGLPWRGKSIEMQELPRVFQDLLAREAEDLLCIYEEDFSIGSLNGRAPGCGPRRTRQANSGC